MLSSQQPSPHLPPIFEPAVIVMEPMTLPCAEQVMQLSVQTEAARSIATEQPDAVSPASSTATGKRPAAGWGEAEISEAARARPNPSRWRRRLAKPDGRCAVRSTLYGADHPLPDGVTDILAESSVTACAFIREMRTQAAEALKAAMDEDETCTKLLHNSGQKGVIYPQGWRGVAELPDVRRVLADRRPLQQLEARQARGRRVAPARRESVSR